MSSYVQALAVLWRLSQPLCIAEPWLPPSAPYPGKNCLSGESSSSLLLNAPCLSKSVIKAISAESSSFDSRQYPFYKKLFSDSLLAKVCWARTSTSFSELEDLKINTAAITGLLWYTRRHESQDRRGEKRLSSLSDVALRGVTGSWHPGWGWHQPPSVLPGNPRPVPTWEFHKIIWSLPVGFSRAYSLYNPRPQLTTDEFIEFVHFWALEFTLRGDNRCFLNWFLDSNSL